MRRRERIRIEAGPFLDDDARSKHYAIDSGNYTPSRADVSPSDTGESTKHSAATAFEVATCMVPPVLVIYDPRYFDSIPGLTTSTPEEYLMQQFTRPAEVFTPNSSAHQDGPGNFQEFPGEFDEMMNVRHIFRTFQGFPGKNTLPNLAPS